MGKKVGGSPIHHPHQPAGVEKTKAPAGLKKLVATIGAAVEGKFGAGKHSASVPPTPDAKRVAKATKNKFR